MSLEPRILSRRQALTVVGAVLAGMGSGCTAIRYGGGFYPSEFIRDRGLRDRVLRAFVLAAVPGAPPGAPWLTRAFDDDLFPFRPYREELAADLARRAERLRGDARFDRLDRDDQVAIIRAGLRGDQLTRKLYAGAVFLAQVSVLGGIYAEDSAVPALRFAGSYVTDEGRLTQPERSALTYADPGRFLAPAASSDGNPA